MANSIHLDTAEPGAGLLIIRRPQLRNALDWETSSRFMQTKGKSK